MNIECLFCDLHGKGTTFVALFEGYLHQCLRNKAQVEDYIVDICISSNETLSSQYLIDLKDCLIHLGLLEEKFIGRFVTQMISGARQRIAEQDLSFSDFFYQYEETVQKEIQSCKPLLDDATLMRFKKHLAQAILEGMLDHVATELPNAVSSGDKDLLKGIMNLFKQAEEFENLLSMLLEIIREMVIKSLGSNDQFQVCLLSRQM